MTQRLLPFETVDQMYERVFRELKPRTEPPTFEVRFYPYANIDSKIRLDQGHRRIRVRISDQLELAPPAVQEALAYVLLGKLYRKPVSEEIVETYHKFVNQAEVRRRALEVRKSRGRKRIVVPRGGVFDLNEIYDDLNRRFFHGELRKPALGWSLGVSRRLLGHYDPAHDAIVISRIFDRPKMPQYVLEYVLYHEMLHLKHPVEYREQRRCVHSAAFKAEERLFPEFEEANRYLRKL